MWKDSRKALRRACGEMIQSLAGNQCYYTGRLPLLLIIPHLYTQACESKSNLNFGLFGGKKI